MELEPEAPPRLLTRLYAGDVGAVVAIWKLIHRPDSTVETSDSSHSGIGSGCSYLRPRVGLAGAERAKNGWRNGSTSQSGFWILGGRDAVGDESGGVTGALLETRSAGRLGRPRRKGRRQAAVWLWLSRRVGLGKLDDAGLAW
jgi:hypothetical protein